MVAGTHDLDLIMQSLKSVFLSGQGLFGKSLYRILSTILIVLDEVNRCEGTPTDFFERSKELMESELVNATGQMLTP